MFLAVQCFLFNVQSEAVKPSTAVPQKNSWKSFSSLNFSLNALYKLYLMVVELLGETERELESGRERGRQNSFSIKLNATKPSCCSLVRHLGLSFTLTRIKFVLYSRQGFSSEAFYCFLSLHHPLHLPLFAPHIIYAPVCLSLALKEIRPSKADGNDALNTSDVWTPSGGEFN